MQEFFKEQCERYAGKNCQECGKRLIGSVFEIAHILAKSNSPEVAKDPLNILGLCPDCHTKFDSNLRNRFNMKVFGVSLNRYIRLKPKLKKATAETRFFEKHLQE